MAINTSVTTSALLPSGAPDPARILASVGEAAFHWDIAADTLVWSANVTEVIAGVPASALGSASEFAKCIDPATRGARFEAITSGTQDDSGNGVAYQAQYALRGDGAAAIWIEETGRWFAGAGGKPVHAHGVVRIITERYAREAQLTLLSRYDQLTGELNRSSLTDAVAQALDDAARFRDPFCFLIVAVDDLSRLNDAFGFDVADEVIRIVAERVRARLRGGDVIGRLSGNKFGVILKNCSIEKMNVAAERFLAALRGEVVPTASGAVSITASVGGIIAPRHARTSSEVISRAQEALDAARRRRPGSFASWRPSPERDAQRRANIRVTDEIVSALNEQRAVIAFEPVVSAATREVVFHECLVRLIGNDSQWVLTPDIVPTAEKLGLIRLVDYRVLELVIEELVRAPDIHLSLNLSPVTTMDPDWWARLENALRASPGVGERLIVEITETVAIRDLDEARTFVTRLKDLGGRIAIDDFGAGYTSFRNLRKLGVDLIKIDGAFVENITRSEDDRVFVQTLIDLARRLKIKTVAEWVQDDEAAALLRDWRCDYLQGRLIGLASAERSLTGSTLKSAAP